MKTPLPTGGEGKGEGVSAEERPKSRGVAHQAGRWSEPDCRDVAAWWEQVQACRAAPYTIPTLAVRVLPGSPGRMKVGTGKNK